MAEVLGEARRLRKLQSLKETEWHLLRRPIGRRRSEK